MKTDGRLIKHAHYPGLTRVNKGWHTARVLLK
jgi:hypothetical protein